MEAALRLVETGEVFENVKDALNARIEELEDHIANAERDLRTKRRLITKLQRDKQREREAFEQRELVERLFDFWRERTKHLKSKLTAERFDAVRGRLEDGYSAREIALAIVGAAFDPFETKAKNGRKIAHNDLELICRDGKRLEGFANRCPRGYRRKNPRRPLDSAPTGVDTPTDAGTVSACENKKPRGERSDLPDVAQVAYTAPPTDIAGETEGG